MEEMRAPDIEGRRHERHEVGHERGLPALDCKLGKHQVGHSHDEVGRDHIVGSAHGEDA